MKRKILLVTAMVAFLSTGVGMAMVSVAALCAAHGVAVANLTGSTSLGIEAAVLCCEVEGC